MLVERPTPSSATATRRPPVWLLDSHFSIEFLSLLARKTPYYAVSIRKSLFAINLHHQPFYPGSHLHVYHDSG
ncbi:hypothetical protein KCU99_g340, partial [Aureobasidium melanogenum]